MFNVYDYKRIIFMFQVGIDLIGPLPETKRGNRYVVTLVDYFSKWPEAEPLQDKKQLVWLCFCSKCCAGDNY